VSDDARKKILARRAKFVAAAVATIGIACGKEPNPPPQPCLSEPYNPGDAEPLPCLTPVVADPPDPPDSGAPTDASTPKDADTEPQPCLKVMPPRTDAGKPTACLKIAPPKDKK